MAQTGQVTNITSDFYHSVAAGALPGIAQVNKFGENNDIDTASVPEDIWNYSLVYTYSSAADIDTFSSSNATDTQDYEIQGLDGSHHEVTQTVTATGQTQVTLTTPLLRVFRIKNLGSTDNAGNIYVYVNGTATAGVPDAATDVRAYIDAGDNQTLMAIYTVPANKRAYITNFVCTLGRSISSVAKGRLITRAEGGVFQVKETFDVSNDTGAYKREYKPYFKVDEKTDIALRITSVTANNTLVTGSFDIILETIDSQL